MLRPSVIAVAGCLACTAAPVEQPHPPVVAPAPPSAPPAAPPTLSGEVHFADGTPAGPGTIVATSHDIPKRFVLVVDATGHFAGSPPDGSYELAASTHDGSAVVATQASPAVVSIALTRDCHLVRGIVPSSVPGTQIWFRRTSDDHSTAFAATVDHDAFATCLPDGGYQAFAEGVMDARWQAVTVPSDAPVRIDAVEDAVVRTPPATVGHVAAPMSDVVDDIIRADARLIGLGEATHGTAEFVPVRGALTMALVERAGVRAILFENDAIQMMKLDDYVMGKDVDLHAAVAGLGFWITDTYEMIQFYDQLRAHNAHTAEPIHVFGLDLQDTAAPIALLEARAAELKISAEQRKILDRLKQDRGKYVLEMSAAQRGEYLALFTRLAESRDLRVAIAGRSMAIQFGYFDGDRKALYGARRDAGMAAIASLVMTRTKTPRACVWAHDGHIQKEPDGGDVTLGQRLSADPTNRYYAVGVYMLEGSARAWDIFGKVGVISHRIPRGKPFTVEGAVMAATGEPDVAWLPVTKLASIFGRWFEQPRLVREAGAALADDETEMYDLKHIPIALDAVVVIKLGHDSSPTPTGVRMIAK